MDKYEIIPPNEFGRKYTIRYKQYAYDQVEGLSNWSIFNNGCAPTCLAIILSSFGYKMDPIDVCKLMLFDEDGPLFFFNENGGIKVMGIIYFLNYIIKHLNYNLEYEIVKVNYDKSGSKKQKIIDMLDDGYMAIILVGPSSNYPQTFSTSIGHYLVVTGVNHQNHEFYVANPNTIGDSQIDTTFSYDLLLQNMYGKRYNFDFLMIRRTDI